MKGDPRPKSKARRSLGHFLQTFFCGADEKREISVEIPGAFTTDGEPLRVVHEIHNETDMPMAFDVHVSRDPTGADGVRITCVVRKPKPKENGEAHEMRSDTVMA